MSKTDFPEFDAAFEFLTGDVSWEDYGGMWCRRVDHRFHVVKILNWEDAVGSAGASGTDGTHHIELVEVDTNDVEQAKSGLDSCGYYNDEDGNIVTDQGDILAELKDEGRWRLVICEAMAQCGHSAPLDQETGSDLSQLFNNVLIQSNTYVDDEEAYEKRMNRPVNRIGSTAREMQKGDINSALLRGLARGDEKAELMSVLTFGRESTKELKGLVGSE